MILPYFKVIFIIIIFLADLSTGLITIEKFPISDIQGSGQAIPFVDQVVTLEGVVTLDRQGEDQLGGFFLQDLQGDGKAATSDGLFIAALDEAAFAVNQGDYIVITGTVSEENQLTTLNNVSALTVLSAGNIISPITLTLPISQTALEQVEGMLVHIPHTMTIVQNYFQGRYGQLTLAQGGRLFQPTNVYPPNSRQAIDLASENEQRLLILDDGNQAQNVNPIPYIGLDNTTRAGDVVGQLTGVIDYGRTGSATDYRLQPSEPPVITRVNQRTPRPTPVGGTLTLASFNVLNYFTTLDNGNNGARGADSAEEFGRQRRKIITALLGINADVVGLIEIENQAQNEALHDLVAGLNAVRPQTYTYVDNPSGADLLGADRIKVALIYKPAAVTPVGVTTTTLEGPFGFNSRPPLVQTFIENSSGEYFTVVVNHFKSKSCRGASGVNQDQGDGQGCFNADRTETAEILAAFLAAHPTGVEDGDYLILGDLNAYGAEDPIRQLNNAGYTDLLKQFVGDEAYTYIFDGLSGRLGYALASSRLISQVTGVSLWPINADEPSVIDYNIEFKSQDLYAPDPYRASDHDPVIIGLALGGVSQHFSYLPLVLSPLSDTRPRSVTLPGLR